MLKNKSIIYFAPERWDGLWRNRQRLMLDFSRSNRVLYVEGRQHLRKAVKNWQRDGNGFLEMWRPSLQNVPESAGLFVYRYPDGAPISGRFPIRSSTRWLRRRSLNNTLRRLGMSSPIVWISRPGMHDLLDEVPDASMKLYHVVDDYASYENVEQYHRQKIREEERQIFSSVDAVITASQNLFDKYRSYHRNTYLVPNGVDLKAYAGTQYNKPLPTELSAIRTPRLGYIGLVGDKLNFDMLLRLACQHPEWSLVFLGEVRVSRQQEQLKALSTLPNAHFLETVPGEQVPNFVRGFQVGLMPYELGNHADHISPLKMYEYLAAGLPVASVDIPAVHEFAEVIHSTSDPSFFPDVVTAALSDDSPARRLARKKLVEKHTWEVRTESISQIIDLLLFNSAFAQTTP